ncbi:MAG: hypothetical protein Q8K55_11005 [Gemmatimonadaceae bacterium]|nr:hypothetical protein [Gemmatimonadaceae bacterium]
MISALTAMPGLAPSMPAEPPVVILTAAGEEVAIIAIIMGTLAGVFFPLVRAWARRLESRSATALPLRDVEDRLDRIERAVESIALEVERVSEGQRFVTKLLAEKATSQLPPAGP